MEQATRSEVTDRTQIEAEVETDATGENVLIKDMGHGFDLTDMDVSAGDASSSGAAASSTPAAAGSSVLVRGL